MVALCAAAVAGGAGPAGAHGGDAGKVHSCIVAGSGYAQIIGANESCSKNSQPLDWSAVDTDTTYSAGAGLALSADNMFSVTGAPWAGLTGVPAGFADGEDDVGQTVDMKRDDQSEPKQPNDDDGFVHWNNLESVPGELIDGDDDGAAKVSQLMAALDGDNADTTPDDSNDLVSLNEIKDLTTAGGDGRITSTFLKNGSVEGADIGQGTITASNLAGRDSSDGRDVVAGAVTSEKILDGTIGTRDLDRAFLETLVTVPFFSSLKNDESESLAAPKKPNDADGYMHWNHLEGVPGDIADGDGGDQRMVHFRSVDPQSASPGERIAVKVDTSSWPFSLRPIDMVTVSPPSTLEHGLVLSGSDVLVNDELTIYLNNVTTSVIDGQPRIWTVRVLR